jgi:hypothetical protein
MLGSWGDGVEYGLHTHQYMRRVFPGVECMQGGDRGGEGEA